MDNAVRTLMSVQLSKLLAVVEGHVLMVWVHTPVTVTQAIQGETVKLTLVHWSPMQYKCPRYEAEFAELSFLILIKQCSYKSLTLTSHASFKV